MPHLQRFHERYQPKGLAVLGFNWADDRTIALELLRQNGVTFLNVLDSSEAAVKAGFEDYKATAVPIQYIIDREGRVVDAWGGEDEARVLRALEKLGVK